MSFCLLYTFELMKNFVEATNNKRKGMVTGVGKRSLLENEEIKTLLFCSTIISLNKTVKNAGILASFPLNQVVREHY